MVNRSVGDNGTQSTDRLIGELIAEVRAVKHATNNNTSKLDGIERVAIGLDQALKEIAEVRRDIELHHSRIAVLEADKNRREGAVGLVEWVSRHWPLSIIAGFIVAVVMWANGIFHK